MRTVVVAAVLAAFVFGSPASAQDDAVDLEDLMASDPEQPAQADEQAADEEPADGGFEDEPTGSSENTLSMSDDERPPGDEPSSVQPVADEQSAEAEPSAGGHRNPLSAGLLAGYGINVGSGANPWSFGFGVRAGYNFSAFYLGGRFVYYAGSSATETRYGVLGEMRTEEVTASLWELGLEGGYDIEAGSVVIRPGLGFGFASASGGNTEAYAFAAPGVSLLYNMSDALFLGLDGRYQVVLSEPAGEGVVLLANLGMRF